MGRIGALYGPDSALSGPWIPNQPGLIVGPIVALERGRLLPAFLAALPTGAAQWLGPCWLTGSPGLRGQIGSGLGFAWATNLLLEAAPLELARFPPRCCARRVPRPSSKAAFSSGWLAMWGFHQLLICERSPQPGSAGNGASSDGPGLGPLVPEPRATPSWRRALPPQPARPCSSAGGRGRPPLPGAVDHNLPGQRSARANQP